MRAPFLLRCVFALFFAAALVACGGGGGASTGSAPPLASGPRPTATPTPTPTPTPATGTNSTTALSSGTLLALQTSSLSVNFAFGNALSGVGATVTGSLSSFVPNGVPAPAARHRSIVAHTGLLYVTLTASEPVLFDAPTQVDFSYLNPDTYTISTWDPVNGWQYDIAQTTSAISTISFTLPVQLSFSSSTFVIALTQDVVSP